MKRIYFILFGFFVTQYCFSQTISPATTTEFCPNVETTFNISVPGTYDNISVSGGCFITTSPYSITTSGGNTTFSFKGKFIDSNQTQTFTVTSIINGSASNFPFRFTKIKSLFNATSASTISLNTVSLVAQRCQIQNFNISFTNVKYGNENVSPSISYGNITNYEYQLPTGWSIGSTTSTGSNWIAGGNNVTVTSDLGTGDGLFVKIRPVNTACGTGLSPGPTKLIAISRPAPTLEIPETQTDICSGSVNYTLTGLPAGATTVWSITNNNSVASISNATNNSVTVNKISANRGVEILTATIVPTLIPKLKF
jgi:hypothetical protein